MVWRAAHTFDSSRSICAWAIRSGLFIFKVPLSLGKPAVSVSRNIGDTVMEQTSENALLNWDVFVTPGIPIVTRDLPPGVREAYFQAMASTLIYGMRDAVLVDAFMTIKQANALADWVAAKGKNLTTIYITHGHGDHWFGIGTLLERFPNARAVATPNVVKVMRQQASPEGLKIWKAAFPDQIPNRPGSTSVISTAWREPRQPLRSCTTRCWSSIRTGSILGGRSGVPHAQLSHERVADVWRRVSNRRRG